MLCFGMLLRTQRCDAFVCYTYSVMLGDAMIWDAILTQLFFWMLLRIPAASFSCHNTQREGTREEFEHLRIENIKMDPDSLRPGPTARTQAYRQDAAASAASRTASGSDGKCC
jgi:hypothetical protein